MVHGPTHNEKHQRFDQITYVAYRTIDYEGRIYSG
jgi:hypothetical protein